MQIRRASEVINGGYNISTYLSPGQLIEMRQNWIDFLQQQGVRNECRDFGEPITELISAQSATIVAPLSDIGLIRVAGEEATAFLNNLLTNDVKGLPSSGVHRNGLCSPKGRLLATFLIWHEGADLMMALSADLHAAILKKLSMYVLRSKVKLSDASDERMLIGISGPEAAKALAEIGPLAPGLLGVASVDHGQVMRLGEQSYLLVADATAAEDMWIKLATRARPAGLAVHRPRARARDHQLGRGAIAGAVRAGVRGGMAGLAAVAVTPHSHLHGVRRTRLRSARGNR